MGSPFTGSIVGSWRLVRSTFPETGERVFYHFLADGRLRSEKEDIDGNWEMLKFGYRVEDGTFTLIMNKSTLEQDHLLTVEDDGTVKIEGTGSRDCMAWWMVRLMEPGADMRHFVDDQGELRKLDAGGGS